MIRRIGRIRYRVTWYQRRRSMIDERGSMKHSLFAAVFLALVAPLIPTAASASAVETACLRSDRPQATRALCRCIGSVANQMLTRSEQRRAAAFFRDPQLAQDVRMSKSQRDNAFWARYRAFGDQAEAACTGR